MKPFDCSGLDNNVAVFLLPMDVYDAGIEGRICQINFKGKPFTVRVVSIEETEVKRPAERFEEYMLIRAEVDVLKGAL